MEKNTLKQDVAFIGPFDKISIFKALGYDVFEPSGQNNTRDLLNKILASYKLILITSDYARFVSDIIEDHLTSVYPLILVIPTNAEDEKYSLDKISESVNKALGVNLNLQGE